MDLKKLMSTLHYGAQHLTQEELGFFSPVYARFQQTGNVPSAYVTTLIDLYKKVAFRQLDVGALVAELQSNVLLLTDTEQSEIEGAQMTFDLSGTLDAATVQRLLQIRGALHLRQHNTLVRKDEPLVADSAPRPTQLAVRPVQNSAPGRRPSARRAGSSALDAAARLLKRG